MAHRPKPELSAAKGLIESNNVFAIVSGSNSALATQYEVDNNDSDLHPTIA